MRPGVGLLVLLWGARALAAAPDRGDATGAPTAPPITMPPEPLSGGDEEATPSKKQRLLAEKRSRSPVHASRVTRAVAHPALTVRNIWTREVLAVDPTQPPAPDAWSPFLRDHFTNQATSMDPRLPDVVLRAAGQFKSTLVEVVSAYRSDKYNLMLRKKGHAVARESQHPLGHAIDFRVAGVATKKLYRFIRSLRLGGAGYYPRTGFVHADVGRVRTWVGN